VAARTPKDAAWTFHETLVEVLRHLNQAAERQTGVDGLEELELERSMARFWAVELDPGQVSEALRVLQENRMVDKETDPAYAWERQRVVGDRFKITADGKAYLLRQVQQQDRIA